MKNKVFSLAILFALLLSLALAACSKTETETIDIDHTAIEQSISDYLATEVAKDYDKADATIPTVYPVSTVVDANREATVYGDFWVENYDIKGDTLECVSGGHYPGVMHLTYSDGKYKVTKFDVVEDGEGYTASAKKLFGENYKTWAEYASDDSARAELRTKTIAEYVKAHDLDVTQYQDYGWEPVSLK